MQIDFEEAFDLVSWKFLYNVLQAFGFDNFIHLIIRLFNTDIKACVTQCFFLSDPIMLSMVADRVTKLLHTCVCS